ncbi:MAG: (Fe-S)-binding protein [Actinomycetota bacterium]
MTVVTGPACCGQPAWNAGHVREAARVAKAARMKIPEGEGPIVVCSGSCVSMIEEYWSELFASQDLGDATAQVVRRVQEFSSFVAGATSGTDRIGAIRPRSISYHDSCHMLRLLGIKSEVRDLLSKIDGLDLHELSAPEQCCGFGGSFALRYPELSGAMADEKVNDFAGTSAQQLVAADLGCLMQICGRAATRTTLSGIHIAQLLDEAMG